MATSRRLPLYGRTRPDSVRHGGLAWLACQPVPPLQQAGLDGGRAALLVSALVDDAAVFPPGSAPVDRGRARAPRRDAAATSASSWGRCSRRCRGSARCSTRSTPTRRPSRSTSSLVADTGLVEAAEARAVLLDDDRVELVGLEVALPADGPLADSARLTLESLDFALPAALEIPRAPGLGARRSSVIAARRRRAREVPHRRREPRCASRAARSWPRSSRPPSALGAAFKLTAGLHRALRRTTEHGVDEHGFVNVLAATASALTGPRRRPAARSCSTSAIRRRCWRSWPTPTRSPYAAGSPRSGRARSSEPIEDLRALGHARARWSHEVVGRGRRRVGVRCGAPAVRRRHPRRGPPRARPCASATTRCRWPGCRTRASSTASSRTGSPCSATARSTRCSRSGPHAWRDVRAPAAASSSPTAPTPTWCAPRCCRSTEVTTLAAVDRGRLRRLLLLRAPRDERRAHLAPGRRAR